jgi:hypothetical protein
LNRQDAKDAKGSALKERSFWVGVAVLVVVALVGAAVNHAVGVAVTYRLGDLTLADPTKDVIKRFGLEGEDPYWIGPVVTHVGPRAGDLGLGDVREGDFIRTICLSDWPDLAETPKNVPWLKYDLARGRSTVVYVWGNAHESQPRAGVRMKVTGTLMPNQWQLAPVRPDWQRELISEDLLFALTGVAELAVLIAIYLVRQRSSKRPLLFLAWVSALGTIIFMTEIALATTLKHEIVAF